MNNNLFVCMFILLLSVGCFWQIFNVCELFFNFPTNVFIETTFDPLSKPLPALTFCATVVGDHSGLNSSDALEIESSKIKQKMFNRIILFGETGYSYSLQKDYLDNSVERISLNKYCITLNTLLSGLNFHQD